MITAYLGVGTQVFTFTLSSNHMKLHFYVKARMTFCHTKGNIPKVASEIDHPRVVSVRYSYSENTFWGNNKSLGEIIIINN